jgi:HK97 family phage prohead protease/HK97 family phage major capsid protein
MNDKPKTIPIDILQMEVDQKSPHWLNPVVRFEGSARREAIRAKHRAAHKGKPPARPAPPEEKASPWIALREQVQQTLARLAGLRAGGGHDVSDEPRDESGKWTDGGGDGGGNESDGHPGEGYSKDAYVKDGVIHTPSVYDAQRALFENRKVELHQPKQVSTLIKLLGKTAAKMEAHGEKVPVFNLCNVSVEGTNLFCAESKGIPRVEMPVIPAKQTKAFIKYLKGEGYKVEKDKEYAANLRATQNEISGEKVAAAMKRIKKEGFYKRLVVSRDDYILDGHHTWAGQLGVDAKDNNLHDDKSVKVARVDISITKLIAEAEKWTGGAGKKPASEAPKSGDDSNEEKGTRMPIKPGKEESQEDWMARCVPDLMGQGGGTERPQEQAVAACMTMWRDAHHTGKQVDPDDVPDPDDDEGQDDFLDRCVDQVTDSDASVDDDDALEACQMAWENRAAKAAVRRKTHAEEVHGMDFILSDESIDRMGDVIQQDGWDVESFKKNPIALFNHNPGFPIGTWKNLRVEDRSLRGQLKLAPEGTSPRIDEIRKLIDAGVLRAVSVGFRDLQSEMRKSEDGAWAGMRFLRQELIETSLVAVPANANALAIAKSLKVSPQTLDLVFAKQGKKDAVVRRGLIGKHADTSPERKGSAMSLAQRITDIEAALLEKRDALQAHLNKIDDSNVSDADVQTSSDLNATILQLEKQHAVLVDSEKALGRSADDGGGGKGNGNGSRSRSLMLSTTATVDRREVSLPPAPKKKDGLSPLDYIVRAATVAYFVKTTGRHADEVRQRIYGDDEPTRGICEIVLRAASAPAMTTVTGWAAELVQQIYTDYMDLLYPKAILRQLAARGISLNFGNAGRIIIPTRQRTPTIAGSFVGEGMAIPVRQGAFASQTLTPKKVAVISVWTREMNDHSIPAIEGLIRDAVQVDTSIAIDSVLIDTNPATVIRPPGLLNGITVTPPTAGGGLPALIGDIKSVTAALVASTFGNLRSPVWLMNPGDVLSASLASAPNTGIFPFRDEIKGGTLNTIPILDSVTVPVKTMILIDAADFVVVGGEAPRLELSDQATLHMEDTAPLDLVGPGSPGVVAAPQRSLFQTDSIALRMVMPLNWVQRRAGTIAYTNTVTWS